MFLLGVVIVSGRLRAVLLVGREVCWPWFSAHFGSSPA